MVDVDAETQGFHFAGSVARLPGLTAGIAASSGGKAEIGYPRVSLCTLDIPDYPADALPPELAAIPATKPGSRTIQGARA